LRSPTAAHHLAPRLVTGAFILHSGLKKRKALNDEQAAQGMHGMAQQAYPFLDRVPPRTFLTALTVTEIGLGAALLLPLVPTAVAGAALTAFSGSLAGLYLRTPGMREEGSLAPTEQGMGLAKDIWMFGIGVGFLTEAVTRRRSRRGHRRRACHRSRRR
jgi:uncharacterized membrane protein YphA (DoxX/SURF4 family)